MVRHFLLRWLGSSVGLWVATALLGASVSVTNTGAVIGAGLLLAIINMFVKPVLILLSLPFIIVTLGLFLIVINGLSVLLVSAIYPPLHVSGLWAAIFAGIIIGLVNYLVTETLEKRER